jgi:ubiquinone/menaquinone biosynthesis C-methylase UbiE
MRSLAFALLAACAHSPSPAPTCPPPQPVAVPVAEPPVVVKPPALDDAAMIALGDAFFAAIDRSDAAAFEAAVAPSFVQRLPQRTYPSTMLAGTLRGRAAQKSPERARTCKNHKIFRGQSTAIYTAECAVRHPAQDDVPAYESDTNQTLGFSLEDNRWKIVFWHWQPLGLETDREMWNETFRQSVNFKKTANQHLIDAIKGRKPGTALDIEMGQGRNVLHLASQGWKVTGVDISDEGIKLAQAAAAKQKLAFEAIKEDIAKYDFGKNRWDLVTMIYAGSNSETVERVKPSIKKGGLFVVEFFHKDGTAGIGIGGFETGALAKQFGDGWTILKDEVVEDIADWTLRKTKLVRFTAQKK